MYYTQIGQPSITRNNVWNLYEQLLEKFENNAPLIASWHLQGYYDDREESVNEVQQALQVNVDTIVDDLIPLRYDDEAGYMGGVNGGLGPEIRDEDLADGIVNFSEDEDSDEDPNSDIDE